MLEEGNKHYITIDDQNRVIAGFSDAFKKPQDGDIVIAEDAGRHFTLLGEVNPPLKTDEGVSLYKYENGEVVERTSTEIQNDIDALPVYLKDLVMINDKTEITADGTDTATITISLKPEGTGISSIGVLVDGPPVIEVDVVDNQAVFEFTCTEIGKYMIEAICGDVRTHLFVTGV